MIKGNLNDLYKSQAYQDRQNNIKEFNKKLL